MTSNQLKCISVQDICYHFESRINVTKQLQRSIVVANFHKAVRSRPLKSFNLPLKFYVKRKASCYITQVSLKTAFAAPILETVESQCQARSNDFWLVFHGLLLWPFLGFFGPLLLHIWSNIAEVFTKDSILVYRDTILFKNLEF